MGQRSTASFVIEGMRDNELALKGKPVTYFPYVEPSNGAAKGLLAKLAKHACTVITDEYPCFFLPALIETVKDQLPVQLEFVDSNGCDPVATCRTDLHGCSQLPSLDAEKHSRSSHRSARQRPLEPPQAAAPPRSSQRGCPKMACCRLWID